MGQAVCACWGPSDGRMWPLTLRERTQQADCWQREGAPGPWQLREESQASPGAAGRAGDHRAEPRAEAAGRGGERGLLCLAQRSGCLPHACQVLLPG